MASGHDGLIPSVSMKNPLVPLREFTALPTVRDGRFKTYSVLWPSQIAKPQDEDFLAGFLVVAKKLNAAIWCNIVATPGERTSTIARRQLIAAWLDCAKADPGAVARTVLAAVQPDEPGEIFPDDGANEFWRGFKSDPASVLFVTPAANSSSK